MCKYLRVRIDPILRLIINDSFKFLILVTYDRYRTKTEEQTAESEKGAKELLRIGLKVWFYRKDRLPPIEERALQIANQGLRDAHQRQKL